MSGHLHKPELGNLRGRLREKLKKVREETPFPAFAIQEPRFFVELPKLKDVTAIDIRYPLLEPFVDAHVFWDSKEKQLVYRVIEPQLEEKEQKLLEEMEGQLTELIDITMPTMEDTSKAMAYLQQKIREILDDLSLTIEATSYPKILYYIFRNFIGLNEIEPLFHDPYIEDIGCAGVGMNIYVTHRKFGSVMTSIVFNDFDILTNFVIKLSERCGRYISYAVPILDGTLPDGSRVQASLAKDVTTKGPTFSLRRFRKNPFSMVDLVEMKTTSPTVMAYLWFLIEQGASILVTGGVATGKTTFLNILSMFIPPEKKIVSIEDTRELNLRHENWIPATTRTGFGFPEASGRRYGEIQLFDLLKESFRMKPDYVIVGEVRGKEAYVLFQGMASGNPSLGTMHSGSVEDVIKRLRSPPIELSPSLIEALDVLVVMVNAREKGKSARRVKEVVEIESMDKEADRAHTSKIFAWIPSVDEYKDNVKQSLLLRKISFEKGVPYEKVMEDLDRKTKIIEWMIRHDLAYFEEASEIINLTYKDPSTVAAWVEKDVPPLTRKTKEREKLSESATGLKFGKEI